MNLSSFWSLNETQQMQSVEICTLCAAPCVPKYNLLTPNVINVHVNN